MADWVAGPGGVRGPQGLPLFKPPWGRITAIDLNTGDIQWWIPNGTTPDRVLENPALAGVDIGNTGQPAHATVLVTKTLLIYAEGRGGRPLLHAVDKATGQEIATVEMPASTNAIPMTFLHDGKQYVVAPVGGGGRRGGGLPGSFVALTLPDDTGGHE